MGSATTKLSLIETTGISWCFMLFYFFHFLFWGVTNCEGNQMQKGKVIRAPIFLVTTSSPSSECQSISTLGSKLRLRVQPLTWCAHTSTHNRWRPPKLVYYKLKLLQLELTFRNFESMVWLYSNNLTIFWALPVHGGGFSCSVGRFLPQTCALCVG